MSAVISIAGRVEQLETDLSAVNPEDGHSGLGVRRRELDFSVDSSRTQKTRVEDVYKKGENMSIHVATTGLDSEYCVPIRLVAMMT